MKITNFKASQVESFLMNEGLLYAASMWHLDIVIEAGDDVVDYNRVAEWFRRYFPSENAYNLFTQFVLEIEMT